MLKYSPALGAVLCFTAFFICAVGETSEVSLRQNAKKEWELLADGRPYFVKGLDYRVTKVGESPDEGTIWDWAFYDFNKNSVCDGAFDSWVDKNGNNVQDRDEHAIGDFELMKRMGVNTIRWYVNDFPHQVPNKALLRDLFHTYGIRVAVGNKFGAYTIDSGASWNEGTDYRDPSQRQRMLISVQRMVIEHKDEPYLLLWLLGNENNLSFTNTNAARYPEVYARFVNQAARLIKKLDGKHPVAVVNGDTDLLFYYKKFCPDVDIFGANSYRGAQGFGNLWRQVKRTLDKPVLITEYGGAEANGFDEDAQAAYHKGCWLNILANRAGRGAYGNAIGGFAFEWMDEWWKAGAPFEHAEPGTIGKQGVGNAPWTQEYCGIVSQGDGRKSPFLRHLRKAYFMYRDLWQ